MRLVTAAVGTFIGVLGTTLHAQDLEPRAYSNSPVGLNFVIAGYGHASGTVLTDPALPLENVSNESHFGVLGFATTFGAFGQTGQFGLIVPYGLDRREGSRVRSAAYAKCRRLCRYSISPFDEFRRRTRADGGGVQ